jgi:hypothetical protein
MVGGQATTLTRANKTSESLRTTVPASIVTHFELKDGDRLKWTLVLDKKGTYVRVEPTGD